MGLLLRYWPHLLALALAFGAGWYVGHAPGAAKAAKAERALALQQRDAAQRVALAEQMAREAEHRHAADMARIGKEHQEALTHAQTAADRLVRDLRAGTVRLQERWRGCAADLSRIAGTAGQPDDGADDRSQSAGRIVRAAAECDAQVIGLQNVIRADRNPAGD